MIDKQMYICAEENLISKGTILKLVEHNKVSHCYVRELKLSMQDLITPEINVKLIKEVIPGLHGQKPQSKISLFKNCVNSHVVGSTENSTTTKRLFCLEQLAVKQVRLEFQIKKD